MALRAVPDHPKFADLQARLNFPKYRALGMLESIWHFTGRFTPQGNIGKYPDQTIEAWIGWDGDTGVAIRALVDSHWLDESAEYRLITHDWHRHADDATRLALKRSETTFCVHGIPTLSGHRRDTGGNNPTPSLLPGAGAVPGAGAEKKTKAPAKAKPLPDPRANDFKLTFQDAFKAAGGTPAPWDAKEATNLARFLKANPTITLEQWQRILFHRSLSPLNQKASLSTWVARSLAWLDAPADEWGKPLTGGKGNGPGNRGQARTDGNFNAARIAAERMAAKATHGAL